MSDSQPIPVIIHTRENGPILISGPVVLKDHLGNVYDTSAKPNIALCRCNGSKNRPFCDGSHKSNGFCAVETVPPAPTPAS